MENLTVSMKTKKSNYPLGNFEILENMFIEIKFYETHKRKTNFSFNNL